MLAARLLVVERQGIVDTLIHGVRALVTGDSLHCGAPTRSDTSAGLAVLALGARPAHRVTRRQAALNGQSPALPVNFASLLYDRIKELDLGDSHRRGLRVSKLIRG